MHVDQLVKLLNDSVPYLELCLSSLDGLEYSDPNLKILIESIKQAINEQEALKIGHLARS